MLSVLPEVDVTWWSQESFHGEPMPEILAARDFGKVFGFLKSRGWSVGAIAAMTRVQEARVREIMAGRRQVTSYEVIERIVTGLSIERGMCGIGVTEASGAPQRQESMSQLVSRAQNLGDRDLALLMNHTDQIRDLHERLGVEAAWRAVTAHVDTLSSLRAFSLAPLRRRQLAEVFHDAACLAGGLAFRGGDVALAWRQHEAAKDAARDARADAALAHTFRQQAMILARSGYPDERRRLEAQSARLRRCRRLPEVSRQDETTHQHGRLYQATRARSSGFAWRGTAQV